MPKHQCKAQNAEQVIQFNVKLHHLIFCLCFVLVRNSLRDFLTLQHRPSRAAPIFDSQALQWHFNRRQRSVGVAIGTTLFFILP